MSQSSFSVAYFVVFIRFRNVVISDAVVVKFFFRVILDTHKTRKPFAQIAL